MRRFFADAAEVVGSANQTLAEVRLPYAIDDDSRCQRILRIGKPASERQPTQARVALAREIGLAACKDRGNGGGASGPGALALPRISR